MSNIDKLRIQNDTFRRNLSNGYISMSKRVQMFPPKIKLSILRKILKYNKFDDINWPLNTHDFGFIEAYNKQILFQIVRISKDKNILYIDEVY